MEKEQAKQKALKFLDEGKTMVVSSVSQDGYPESATVTFIPDGEFNVYFITRKSSRKYANLRVNPKVSVVVGFDPEKPSTLQMQGLAKVTHEGGSTAILEISKKILTKGYSWWPLLKISGLDFVVFKIEVDWARWLDSEENAGGEETYIQVYP